MKYIGNLPEFNITHTDAVKWDYILTGNPTVSTNPSSMFAKALNKTTGEEFNCIDNTPEANVWVGQLGTTVQPS